MSVNQLHIFDITIPKDDIERPVLQMLATVRPNWPSDQVNFITFTDGITNKLMGAHLAADKDDVVLVRVYGEGSDLMIDRQLEMQNMLVLHMAGCARQLYGSFNNGLLYGYVPGKCLDVVSVLEPKVTKLIIEGFVRMMAIDPDMLELSQAAKKIKISKEPCLFPKSWKFLELVPDIYPDPKQNERRQTLIKSKAELAEELKGMEKILTRLECPVVFCHNDLLLNNIVYDEKSDAMMFIDYEYGAFNYLPFDIGNHFCEYAGVDTVDYDLYPDREYQMTWLRQFLQTKAEFEGRSPDAGGSDAVSEEEVQQLYAQANKFALMAHFFWGLWGLIQARYSVIDFDYLEYASIRFNEYFRRKEEFLAL